MALPFHSSEFSHDCFSSHCDEVISPRWRAWLVIVTAFTLMMLVFGAVEMTKNRTVEQILSNGNTSTIAHHERAIEIYGTESERGPLKALAIGVWGLLVGAWILVMGE
ncbi:hypothetical protein BDZ45DRAFT_30169 [Acephala macrosclerotiorum]|nr:hypothetical protein BDZ45DRAFT_30169 [Acephala macrosclerotiorum]